MFPFDTVVRFRLCLLDEILLCLVMVFKCEVVRLWVKVKAWLYVLLEMLRLVEGQHVLAVVLPLHHEVCVTAASTWWHANTAWLLSPRDCYC